MSVISELCFVPQNLVSGFGYQEQSLLKLVPCSPSRTYQSRSQNLSCLECMYADVIIKLCLLGNRDIHFMHDLAGR